MYDDAACAYSMLDLFGVSFVAQGGARGADALAGQWAQDRGVSQKRIPAEWIKHGRAAGHIRNAYMLLEKPDLVIAFPGGTGTADMVRQAKKAGVCVVEIT
jgi:hypothetical protein